MCDTSTYLNILKTISALSYSKPQLRICSATKQASENSGGLRPISVKCIMMLFRNWRWRIVRTLSPTHTKTVELASSRLRSAIKERMCLATFECTLPHSPLSEDMAKIRCFGLRSSSNTSAFSNRADVCVCVCAYYEWAVAGWVCGWHEFRDRDYVTKNGHALDIVWEHTM